MLNTNISPYYDDYNPTSDYYRILYKPGYAVQSRELNQMQSIQQQQISYLGASIYSQNTPVSGGGVTTNLECYYVKLSNTYSINNVDVDVFKGKVITNGDGDVEAQVLAVAQSTGITDGVGDQPTLIVNYLSGSKFKNGETVYVLNNGTKVPRAKTYPLEIDESHSCTGLSSTANVAEGVFFVMNGSNKIIDRVTNEQTEYKTATLVRCGKQTIILNKYDNKPSCRIGLEIEESIVSVEDDKTLFDPALESSNFEAPGADRYKIYLRLVKKPLEYGGDENFIELCKVEDGTIKKQVSTEFSDTIEDYVAKLNYEIHGDYIVSDFDIEPIAYTQDEIKNGDSDMPNRYKLKIGKGVAHVRGYRIENQSEIILDNNRARTTDSSKKFMYMNYGTYLKVRNGAGNAIPTEEMASGMTKVFDLCSDSNGTKVIGSADLKTIEFSNTKFIGGTSQEVFNLYLTNVVITQNNQFSISKAQNTTLENKQVVEFTVSSVNDIYVGAKIVIEKSNNTNLKYTGTVVSINDSSNLVCCSPAFVTSETEITGTVGYVIPSISDVKSIGLKGSSSTNYLVVDESCMDSDGNTILLESSMNDAILSLGNNYTKAVNNVDYNKDIFFDSVNDTSASTNYGNNNTGKFNIYTSRSSGMLSSSTGTVENSLYTNAFVRNNIYTSNNANKSGLIYLNSDFINEKTTVGELSAPVTGKVFVRAITGTSDFGLTLWKSSYLSDESRTNKKTLNFYCPHITNLKYVLIVKSGYSISESTNINQLIQNSDIVTSRFSFVDGQKDDIIDFSTLVSDVDIPKDRDIVAIYDAFITDLNNVQDYISIESYLNAVGFEERPLNVYDLEYVSTNGTTYKLADSLDFRPRARYGVSSSITSSIYTYNGYVTDDCSIDCVQEYYLGRYDILVLSKEGGFQLIHGSPALNPKVPETPDGCLLIATIEHDPYTYYLPEEAPRGVKPNLRIIKNKARRWTMGDISGINKRIDNIEYYTALNMLEQTAQNMQVLDSDGLNRFKNGILVDNFTSYLIADVKHPEFKASINKIDGTMSMAYEIDNFAMVEENDAFSNIKKHTVNAMTNNYILDYTTKTVTEQPLASKTVNVNPFGVPVYQGQLSVNPPMDNWVDNKAEPDIVVVDAGIAMYTESDDLNVLNVTNWQSIPGTSTSTKELVGTDVKTSTVSSRTSSQIVTTNTTTTTSTYKTTTTTEQARQITSGYYSYAGDSYNMDNGFITDISIQPYIRPQDLLIYADGLASNCPVSTWFDGTNVDNYFKMADVIEMAYSESATRFEKGDIIGYRKSSDQIYPIGVVIGTYFNKVNSIARLYVVSSYLTSIIVNDDISIVKIRKNGSLWSNADSATYGRITSGKVITDSFSGPVCAVGKYNADNIIFGHRIAENSTFLQRYGVFKNYTGSSTSGTTLVYRWTPTNSVTVYPAFQSTLIGSTITIEKKTGGTDANEEWETIKNYTINLNTIYSQVESESGITLSTDTYRITVTTPNTSSELINNQIALAFSDARWNSVGETDGYILWSTRTPLEGSVPSDAKYSHSNNVIGGGIIYEEVSQICVGCSSESMLIDDYYTGATIVIDSYGLDLNRNIVKLPAQVSIIGSFDKNTGTIGLETPVTISYGYNNITKSDITATYNVRGNTSYKLSNNSVSGISTNEDGVIAGIFSVPENMFKTGERTFRIDNRTVPTDSSTATCYAEGLFTASGLSTKSQSLSFSASVDSMANVTKTSENRKITNVAYSQTVDKKTVTKTQRINRDPLAQTFMVNSSEFPTGCFLSGIKVFFQSKPTELNTSVSCRIVTTDNGYPTSSELDNSIVTLSADKVIVSDKPNHKDRETWTNFEFQTPVYIQPDTLYAFILKSDSTDYNVWMAKQNGIALNSTIDNADENADEKTVTKIGNVPYVGNLFSSQNSSTWVADITESMMFVIDRCVFDPERTAKLVFSIPEGNNQRKSLLTDTTSFYSGALNNGDYEADALNFTTTDFTPVGTKILYNYTGTTENGAKISADIVPGKFGCPTFSNISLDDGYGPRIIKSKDNDSLVLTAYMSTDNDAVSPIISDDGVTVYTVKYLQEKIEETIGGEVSEKSVAKGRYISKKATLASGNTSGDMLVYLSGCRPYNTDLKVFVKIKAIEDPASFDECPWIELEEIGDVKQYSDNKDDIIEMKFAYGELGTALNHISYKGSNGVIYTSFNQFSVKIEMTTSDNTKVPTLNSLIAIALPSE